MPENTGSVAKVDAEGQQYFQLSAMLKDATPQLLESSVEASVKLLDTLRAPLADKLAGSPDAEHWIQAIENLKKQAVKTKTVIGVVGNTGAGKSSVINAMLGQYLRAHTLHALLMPSRRRAPGTYQLHAGLYGSRHRDLLQPRRDAILRGDRVHHT